MAGKWDVGRPERDAVLTAYANGVPPSTIAEVFGIPASRVARWARVAHIDTPPRHHDRDDTVVASAIAAYAAGQSTEQIAAAHGVCGSTVLRWVRTAGLPVRIASRWTNHPADRDAIVAAYLSGRTSTDVAAEYGVCYPTVLKWVRQAGGHVRPRFGNPTPDG